MKKDILKVKKILEEKDVLHELQKSLIIRKIEYYARRIEILQKEAITLRTILIGTYTIINSLLATLRMLGFDLYYAGIVLAVVTTVTLIGYELKMREIHREIEENEKTINTIYELILEDPMPRRVSSDEIFIIAYGILTIAIAIILILI